MNIEETHISHSPHFRRDNISFALLTRIQRNELPFLNEFLAYYKKIGIDRFYLVNTELENREIISTSVPVEYWGMVELVDKNPEDGLDECFDCALPKIKETFLLNVDMDEFLYLNGISLYEFIEREGLHGDNAKFIECAFSWIMSPLCQELYAPSIHTIIEKRYFFPAHSGKSFARTQDIASITPHYFKFLGTKPDRKYYPSKYNYFIFHVSSRGIFDILNKVQYGQYPDLKKTHDPKKELYDLIFNPSSRDLPSRFILLAFQSRFTPYLLRMNFEFPNLEYETNVELLKDITLNGLKDLLGVEIVEKDLEEVILEKIKRYPVPQELINMYAAGRISLLKVLKVLGNL